MHLFVIYIGGAHQKSLIELHDMRFVVADFIEDTYDSLRQSWWGIPNSLHLDAWGILQYVDGYRVHIADTPAKNTGLNLYFINLGGYDPLQFTELHKNIFVVASDELHAKQKALQQIQTWHSPHRDYLHQVDEVIDISAMLVNSNQGYLHLIEDSAIKAFDFTCRYTPIGK